MTIIRIIVATVILLFAAYIVVLNWCCVIVSLRNKRRGIDRHHSTVPLFSLFITIVAMAAYPRQWMIAVPFLDIANWSLLWLPFGLIRELRRQRAAPENPPPDLPAREP